MSADDIRIELLTILSRFPAVLIPTILDYGMELPHRWTGIETDGTGTEATIKTGVWNHIVSAQSIFDGPNRWQIRTKFLNQHGWMTFGITSTPTSFAGDRKNFTDRFWNGATGIGDLLVRTSMAPYFLPYDGNMLLLSNSTFTMLNDLSAAEFETTAYVEVDWPNRLMLVSQVVTGKTVRIRKDIPTDAVYRPVVVAAGCLSATILDWTDGKIE